MFMCGSGGGVGYMGWGCVELLAACNQWNQCCMLCKHNPLNLVCCENVRNGSLHSERQNQHSCIAGTCCQLLWYNIHGSLENTEYGIAE